MSINQILNTGVSALMANQAALRVTSGNISNVNTPEYARRLIDLQTNAIDGQVAGVEIAQIRRATDTYILKQLRSATADSEQYNAMLKLHEQLQGVLGDPAANSSLTGKLDRVFTGLAGLPLDPTSGVARMTALNDIQTFGDELGRISAEVQSLRLEADRRIVQDIDLANDAIKRVYDLNAEIVRATNAGEDTTTFEDQRDAAVAEISKFMDIRTHEMSDGRVTVSTGTGVALVDYTYYQLTYQGATTAAPETRFSQITVNQVNPSTGQVAASGTPLDPALTGGSLRGWLNMRNVELPRIADTVGMLAASVADKLNAVHNDNVAVPPPAVLTGRNTGLVAGDPHGFTGEATFYSYDANNDAVGQVTVDFDSGAINTMGDVIAAVNGALGAGTLALSGGVLTMTAQGGATGVGIAQEAADPSARGGRGFAQFFGMNDLVQTSVPMHYDTGFQAGDAHGFTGTTEFEFRGPNGEVTSSFTVDFGAIGGTVNDVVNELQTQLGANATVALDADGALSITPNAGYETHRLMVVTDTTDRAGTGAQFADMFGIGPRYPAAAATDFKVRDDIMSDPDKLALADAAASLTAGDNRGALAFQQLAQAEFDFDAIGGLSGTRVTLSQYASQVLAKVGLEAARAESLATDRGALKDELVNRREAVSGVNMDEELSNMIVYQNAYNSAARLITAAREMYDVLIRM